MGGKYELRCFDPINADEDQWNCIEYYNNWFQMRKAYRKRRKQYETIYLTIRKTLKY